MARYDPEAKAARNYVRVIVRRLFLDKLRRQNRLPAQLSAIEADPATDRFGHPSAVDPVDANAIDDDRKLLQEAIKLLRPRYQEILH